MFCPECKAEYIDGIIECADCHVPLVWTLPQESQETAEPGEPVEWAPLVSCSNQGDLALIKSLLESESILYWVQGEHRGMMPHGLGLGAIVHVDKDRLDDAKAVIKDVDLNILGFSIRSSDEID
ncbi:DUF2007 domain-containing protein [candidate division KSB1 bacterium]|nr:DUF2007 domain-containing protein [candidate division KSB1 bacterium]RQW11808.1 MAG: hypothetical protein EH222_00080 [candidate division KSB1 bacterium]